MLNKAAATSATISASGRRWAGVIVGTLVAASLAACGSNVKLDEVPVVDRSSSAVSDLQSGGAAGPAGTAGAVDQRGVSGVEVAGGDVAQPTAMARLVYFDFDSFEVRAEFAPVLEAHAKYLSANSNRRVALEGHTDERGGREYNLALGQKRSEAVRRTLSLLGVNEAQMEAVSFGEEKPAVVGFDEAAFAKNRRVELTYR
ncbi:peptidoglycan-associated lipoprotein Pal [Rhodoferax sp.]|uniref:peptidoglycan-associated lipoprotein Pal n=1 Tax=Rhodoferax sp. TaxID=50421 RepID=UPI002774D8AB|nr:peptidoglycan-associated lipoprotein Pal [Rhodoferax sp.]MDP2418306.1 peptidoglycan-associated lipoprotein Pal [Hydrogenophaga sp.]MDZ4207050.1 peptidoglycan-associated lipoprotein Pal [Rhodoferax sp.]